MTGHIEMGLIVTPNTTTVQVIDETQDLVRRVRLHKHEAYRLAVHLDHLIHPTPEIVMPSVPALSQVTVIAARGGVTMCVHPPATEDGPSIYIDLTRSHTRVLINSLINVAVLRP